MYNFKKLIENKNFNKKGSYFVGVNILLVAVVVAVVLSTGTNTKKSNVSVLASNVVGEVAENINPDELPFDDGLLSNIIEETEAVAETESQTEDLTLATKPNVQTSKGTTKTDTNVGKDNTNVEEEPSNEVANDTNEVVPTETVELSISGKSNEEYKQMAINNKANYQALLNEVFELLNQERANVGVAPLTPEYTLDIMAGHRSAENADCDFFEHDSHHYRPFKNRNSDGYKTASSICHYYGRYGNFAEVMGKGQTTAASIVTSWHNSAPHYAAIIDPKYTKVGVGLALGSDGKHYWTAILMDE